MTSEAVERWFLCADGGGTAVKVVVVSTKGKKATATGGPCNLKSVGPAQAAASIVSATLAALSLAGSRRPLDDLRGCFTSVWLGIAGVMHNSDAASLAPLVGEKFGFEEKDPALRVTNDGHLLASPCLRFPGTDSTIAIVAGTGSAGFAFRKLDTQVELVGRNGGHGYILGDEGSAYHVGRLCLSRFLASDDLRVSFSLSSPSAPPPPRVLPLYTALLQHLDVSDTPALIDKIYANPSLSAFSFPEAETARKVQIASAARVVFRYAYELPEEEADKESRVVAREILEEAALSLVDLVLRLLRTTGEVGVRAERAVLALGGGMWNSAEYRRLLTDGLKEKGVEFAEVVVVESAAEEGAKALMEQYEEKV
ncbi:hypothetical protein JCM8547_001512 [Rhodosporidiobolus lusitaniae]